MPSPECPWGLGGLPTGIAPSSLAPSRVSRLLRLRVSCPVFPQALCFPVTGCCSSAFTLLASPRSYFVLQPDCRLFKCRARLCPPCDWRPGQSSAHTGRSLDAQRVNWLLPLPPAQGTRPCPLCLSSLRDLCVFHPRGLTWGPAVVSTPGYLLTASLAFVSTPCLFLPAGQPRGTVGTGRIWRKEPPLCAERSRTLPHWAAAPRKETLSRGSCRGRVEPGWGSSWRVWAPCCCLEEPWGLPVQPCLLCSQTPETQDLPPRGQRPMSSSHLRPLITLGSLVMSGMHRASCFF